MDLSELNANAMTGNKGAHQRSLTFLLCPDPIIVFPLIWLANDNFIEVKIKIWGVDKKKIISESQVRRSLVLLGEQAFYSIK